MTNGWVDMKNTDMMLIMGGNPAENHPCGFKWPIEAKRTRNAKIISVDPRFTRTSAVADLFCQIRAGTDIAFLGGVIRYAIENNRIAKDYLVNFTNAAFIVKPGFQLPGDTDGIFSGFDAKTQTYDKSTWNYAGADGAGKAMTEQKMAEVTAYPEPASPPPALALPETLAYDLSLQNPNCVFQLLKKHYSRYTPEMVERITGIPKEQFLKAADLYTSIRKDGDMKKAGTIIYAVGWTQHTFGTQIIRTAAILQLLLGNVGRAGGGVNALRGHSNIQGATDMAGLFDTLPGYLKVPTPADTSFADWTEIRGQLSESPLWRRGHETKRVGLRLSAESGSQLFVGADVGRHVQRVCERHACLWDERRGDRSQLKEKHRRAEKSGLAGSRRDLSRRDQRVLEVARDHHGRDETDSDHGVSSALRGFCRERRFVHQFRALVAMGKYRSANARRCPAGPGHRGANFLEDPRAV